MHLFNDSEKGTRILFNGKTEYPVGDLQAFTVKGVYFANLPLVHKQGDRILPIETLVRRVVQGKVNVYSRFNAPEAAKKELRYDYFAKSGDAIQEIGYAKLKTALKDNPESLEHLQSSRTWRTLRTTMLVTGLLTTGVGIYKTFTNSSVEKTTVTVVQGREIATKETESQFKPSPLLFAGFGVALSSLIPGKISHNKYRKAIDVYNIE